MKSNPAQTFLQSSESSSSTSVGSLRGRGSPSPNRPCFKNVMSAVTEYVDRVTGTGYLSRSPRHDLLGFCVRSASAAAAVHSSVNCATARTGECDGVDSPACDLLHFFALKGANERWGTHGGSRSGSQLPLRVPAK